MELHREIGGVRLDINESKGLRPGPYLVVNPYGCLGVMVGFNGPRGHCLSVTEASSHENRQHNDRVYQF